MSRTRKPCPGCGEVHPARPADGVCYDCKKMIQLGRDTRAAADAPAQERKPYVVPDVSHGFEYIHYVPYDERAALTREMLRMVTLIGQPYHGSNRQYNCPLLIPSSDGMHGSPRLYTDSEVEIIRKFWDALDVTCVATYEDGRAKGRSLLLGLANGETSVDDLNEECLRQHKEGQALLERFQRRQRIYSKPRKK